MALKWKWALSNLLLVCSVLGLTSLYLDEGLDFVDFTLLVLVAALVGVFSFAASRFALRPLRHLTAATRNLASGNLSGPYPLSTESTSELAELEGALSDLGLQTRERIAQITTEKSRLETILNSITEGILVVGLDGRIALANRALGGLFGAEFPLEGRRPVEVARNSVVEEAIDQGLESGEEIHLETSLAGGVERHLDVRVAPVGRGDEQTGVVVVFYDVTRLRQLERMRKDFVANVSHELRTPLTTIKGCAETLEDGALEDRRAAERFLGMITSQSGRLNLLLEHLLELSRLESDDLEIRRESCVLRPLVENCAAGLSQLATGKNIPIEVDIPMDLEVNCDPRQIEQALFNLLDNAVKYTPENGKVQVSARHPEKESGGENQHIAIEVRDTGIGISSEHQKRVFERFYRVDTGRSRALGGTGLGLSIVRHIAEAHGGGVYVKSAMGQGSTFGITLPATPSECGR